MPACKGLIASAEITFAVSDLAANNNAKIKKALCGFKRARGGNVLDEAGVLLASPISNSTFDFSLDLLLYNQLYHSIASPHCHSLLAGCPILS